MKNTILPNTNFKKRFLSTAFYHKVAFYFFAFFLPPHNQYLKPTAIRHCDAKITRAVQAEVEPLKHYLNYHF